MIFGIHYLPNNKDLFLGNDKKEFCSKDLILIG